MSRANFLKAGATAIAGAVGFLASVVSLTDILLDVDHILPLLTISGLSLMIAVAIGFATYGLIGVLLKRRLKNTKENYLHIISTNNKVLRLAQGKADEQEELNSLFVFLPPILDSYRKVMEMEVGCWARVALKVFHKDERGLQLITFARDIGSRNQDMYPHSDIHPPDLYRDIIDGTKKEIVFDLCDPEIAKAFNFRGHPEPYKTGIAMPLSEERDEEGPQPIRGILTFEFSKKIKPSESQIHTATVLSEQLGAQLQVLIDTFERAHKASAE